MTDSVTTDLPASRASCFWKGFGCSLVGLLGIMVLLFIGIIFTISQVGTGFSKQDPYYEEKFLQGEEGAAVKIGVIYLVGPITPAGSSDEFSVSSWDVVDQIQYFEACDEVGALLLYIDSPGGEVTASDEIYRALCDYKIQTGKPIIAYGASMAASGGFYIACAADSFIVHKTCLTGSVGVIMGGYQYFDLMKKIGVGSVTLKSGNLKDALSPERPATSEELLLFQNVVDSVFDEFVQRVSEGRFLSEAVVRRPPIGDGRIILGKNAIPLGLADRCGYYGDALELAVKMAGFSAIPWQAVTLEHQWTFSELLLTMKAQTPSLSVKLPALPSFELQRGTLYFILPTFVQ